MSDHTEGSVISMSAVQEISMPATTTTWIRQPCAHCGLPVAERETGARGPLYCCHACRIVSSIIGRQEQGKQTWNLLRLAFGALLSMNVMMISILLYTGSVEPSTVPAFRRILLALASPALAILVYPFILGAVRDGAWRRPGLDALVAGGAVAAFAVSAVNVIRGVGHIYFDTATMLPVLVTFGKIIEATAKTNAADLLKSLEKILPTTAVRITVDGTEEVAVDQLRPGDLVRVRPGERIAVDGLIRDGCTTIEEAAFTGESRPRVCSTGDRVIAGTINGTGGLTVETELAGRQVLLHRLIAIIEDVRCKPAQAERIAERAATLFVPAVLLIAAGTAVFWNVAGDPAKGWLCALSVVVVACPCTMGIATALATSLAIGRAAEAGIVVRGGDVMELVGKTDIVFFDKTGTLTTDQPAVKEIRPADPGTDENELLCWLAALESGSEHTLAGAVIAEANERGLAKGKVSRLTAYPGRGVAGTVDVRGVVREVTAGTAAFVRTGDAHRPEDGSCTVIEVAWDGVHRGRILLADSIRDQAKESVEALRRQSVSTVLLSGDRLASAEAIGKRVGIDCIEAPRTPEEKVRAIEAAVAAGRVVAMVGDGINDAPALSAAHTGIALDGGMDLARQSADVVILSDRLAQVPWLIKLSREARKIIRQNFAWSFGYNLIALSAAAAGWLHPLLAAVAMVVSSLTVLGNSMRIGSFPDEHLP